MATHLKRNYRDIDKNHFCVHDLSVFMSEVKHDPLQITGKVRPSNIRPITHFKIKGLGFKTYQQCIQLIEQGYDLVYKPKSGDLSNFTVKDTINNDGTVRKDLVTVRDGVAANNIEDIPEIKLTE